MPLASGSHVFSSPARPCKLYQRDDNTQQSASLFTAAMHHAAWGYMCRVTQLLHTQAHRDLSKPSNSDPKWNK